MRGTRGFLTTASIAILKLAQAWAGGVEPAKAVSASEPGLVLYWTFDEGRGDVIHDSSGNGNNGRLGAGGPTWIAHGVKKGAIGFDGIDDFVDADRLPKLTDYTFEAWIYTEKFENGHDRMGDGSYFVDRIQSESGKPLASLKAAAGQFAHQYRDDLRTAVGAVLGGLIKLNTWQHVTWGRQRGKELFIGVDGVRNALPDGLRELTLDRPTLGAHGSGHGGFAGMMDEFKVYARALSEEESKAHYEKLKDAATKANARATKALITGAQESPSGSEQAPEDSLSLTFFLGIQDGARQTCPTMDGVTLKVEVIDGASVPVTVYSATQDQSSWSFHRTKLDRYAGRTVTLRLQVHPNGNTLCDWTLLGDPRVVDGRRASTSTSAAPSATPRVVAELAKLAPVRTGIVSRQLTPSQEGVRYLETEEPLDSEGTGAVVTASGEKTANGIARPGYYFHPPWKQLQGSATFADFVVSLPKSPDRVSPAR